MLGRDLSRRLQGVEAGLEALKLGQAQLGGQLDGLRARDSYLEGQLSGALDRMTVQLVQQAAEYRDAMEQQSSEFMAALARQTQATQEQTLALRDSLLETRAKRVLIKVTGRGLKWIERGIWPVLGIVGWKMWISLAHVRGWDGSWWWPW